MLTSSWHGVSAPQIKHRRCPHHIRSGSPVCELICMLGTCSVHACTPYRNCSHIQMASCHMRSCPHMWHVHVWTCSQISRHSTFGVTHHGAFASVVQQECDNAVMWAVGYCRAAGDVNSSPGGYTMQRVKTYTTVVDAPSCGSRASWRILAVAVDGRVQHVTTNDTGLTPAVHHQVVIL